MSDITPVTYRQLDGVRNMASAKGVSRWRFQENVIENGMMSACLDAALQNPPVNLAIKATTPVIHLPKVSICSIRLRVDLGVVSWGDLIRTSCPDTHHGESSIMQAESEYPPQIGTMEDNIFLLNSGFDNGWDTAHYHAHELGLVETDPRWAFSLCSSRPHLHQDLGKKSLWVVATKGFMRQGTALACAVGWEQSGAREAWVNGPDFFARPNVWFAFREPERD